MAQSTHQLTVSLIIPTYNERTVIVQALEQVSRFRGICEVIVADGRSTDGTRAAVKSLIDQFPCPLRIAVTERDRALQLNRAAQVAAGDVLLFLHADTFLPHEGLEALEAALGDASIVGGNFRLRFDGESAWSTAFTWVDRTRRRFGIYYGDSALFVRRTVFMSLGGFKPIPVMEDYEFVRRMERTGRTVCLSPCILVSDRRWRVQGVLRTMLSWFWIQLLYSLGVPPQYLADWYRPVRGTGLQGHKSFRQQPSHLIGVGDELCDLIGPGARPPAVDGPGMQAANSG